MKSSTSQQELTRILEAILFASPEPLSERELANILECKPAEVRNALEALISQYRQRNAGICIRKVSGGYQMRTAPEMANFVSRIRPRPTQLSGPALETLAIIAYRQPITKSEIELIRGVKVDSVLETLLARGLIKEVGRKNTIGKPVIYGTTQQFLTYFGLNSLSELPPLPPAEE